MVFTIHRYIFRELLKTFAAGTLVLSLVLGMGGILRPLRQFGVDPTNVPELLAYTLPITLTLTMPIAALLAATLTYGRLAADREIDACRASGIGLMTLIYPALTLALLVGMATLLLGFHVIPSYTAKLEAMVQRDAEAILYRNIQKDGRLHGFLPDVILHADMVYPDRHLLTGVAAVRTSREGFEKIVTARQVDVHVDTSVQPHKVSLGFWDASLIDERGSLSHTGHMTLSYEIPGFWRDHIKFKKLSELQEIRLDMSQFGPIVKSLEEIRRQAMIERFCAYANQHLQAKGFVEFWRPDGRIRLYAKSVYLKFQRQVEVVPIDGESIRVESYHGRKTQFPDRRYLAEQATFLVDPELTRPAATLDMQQLEWFHLNESRPQRYYPGRLTISQLDVPMVVVRAASDLQLEEVLDEQEPVLDDVAASEHLTKMVKQLRRDATQLLTDIEVELHSRLAFGVSCVVLVLLGAALGIMFRSAHLLMAFGVSILPAALCLITIFTGKHMAEHSDISLAAGEFFLWSGIVVVAAADLITYYRLTRT